MGFSSFVKSSAVKVADPNAQPVAPSSGLFGGILQRLLNDSVIREAMNPTAAPATPAPAPAQPSPLAALAQQGAATPAIPAPQAAVAEQPAAAAQLPSWVARPDIAVGQPSVLAGVRAPEAMSAQYRVPNMQSGYTTLQAQLLRAYNPRRVGELPGSPLAQYGMNPEDEQRGAPYGY